MFKLLPLLFASFCVHADPTLLKGVSLDPATKNLVFTTVDGGQKADFSTSPFLPEEQQSGVFHVWARALEGGYLILEISEDFVDVGSIYLFSGDDSGYEALLDQPIPTRKAGMVKTVDDLLAHLTKKNLSSDQSLIMMANYFTDHSGDTLDGFVNQLAVGNVATPKAEETAQEQTPAPAPATAPAPAQHPWGEHFPRQPQQPSYGYNQTPPGYAQPPSQGWNIPRYGY